MVLSARAVCTQTFPPAANQKKVGSNSEEPTKLKRLISLDEIRIRIIPP